MRNFPHYKQPDAKDCGPTCLKIIAKHYKKNLPLQYLRHLTETTREGSSLMGISEASEKIGFRSLGIKVSLEQLLEAPLPCILHWNKVHFVVLYKIQKDTYYISDPAHGLLKYTKQEFLKNWIGNNANETTEEGIALLLKTTPKFYENDALSFGRQKNGNSTSSGGGRKNYVAFELGISQKAYSEIEKGKTNISHKKILRLSKVLETTPDKICPIAQQCMCYIQKK